MLVPKLKAPKGYIRLNETSYDKLVNYHFANGFCILTAFRSEFTMSQNRARNKKLAADLKANDLGFIRVTGGYREVIDKDNVNWDDAERIPDNDDKRLLTIMEESLLVPNFNVKTKQPFEDFDKLKDIIIDLGIKYEQDSVLVSPPNSDGNAYYVITNERYGDLGDIDIKFDKMDLASITDTYFSSLSKTINKLKVKRGDGVGGFKFEKKKYVCTFVDEPSHTLAGMRSENASGALPVFGSHYYETSTLAKKTSSDTDNPPLTPENLDAMNETEDIIRHPEKYKHYNSFSEILKETIESKESEPYAKKSDVDSILNKYFNKYNDAFRRLSE